MHDAVPSPPWYRRYRGLGLLALLLIAGAAVAFFALRDGDDAPVGVSPGPQPRQAATETGTQTTEPETAEMPDVVGARYPDAVGQLLDAGLLPESFPVESTDARGVVVDERPAAGTPVALASAVRIDISLGSGERAARQVPDLTGLSLADALRVCAEAGFTCRAVPAGGAGREVTAERPLTGGPAELSQIELSTG